MTDLFIPVQKYLQTESSLALVEQTIRIGADVNSWSGPQTPLKCAVQACNPNLLQCLLKHDADPNLVDSKGVTPLHLAVFEGRAEVVRLLLDAGADANSADRHGQTPIFFAPSRLICELLYAKKADLNARNRKDQSALHLAAHAGLNETVAWLAEAKGILDAQDQNGRTAAHYAHYAKVKSTVGVLKSKGADVTIKAKRRNRSMKPIAAVTRDVAEEANVAEEARLASEAEEARWLEKERLAAEAEEARRAEEEGRLAAEKARLAAEAEEARRLEEKRLAAEAEEARRAEEERIAAEEACLAAEAEEARRVEEQRLAAEAEETRRVEEESRLSTVGEQAEAPQESMEEAVPEKEQEANVAEEACLAAEAEEARRLEEERLAAEAEEARRAEEEERLAAEEARLAAEAEEARRVEEERLAAEAEEAPRAEEEPIVAEESRLAAEAEEARRVEEERLAAEAEEARRVEEERLAAEAEEAPRAEEEQIAAEESRLAAEAEEARRVEEQRLAAEAEESRRVEEERLAADAEEARRAEEEERIAAEEARLAAEAEEARRVEEERLAAEAEEAPRAEEEPIVAEESRLAAEAEEARRVEEERLAAEAEEARRVEEERLAAEAEEARRAEEEERIAAEEARLAAEAEEARRVEEERLAAEAEEARRVEEERLAAEAEEARRAEEEERLAAEAEQARLAAEAEHARKVEEDTDPKATEVHDKALQTGDRVEVYSNSKQKWFPGVITDVFLERPEPMVRVEYHNGYDTFSKEIATRHPNLRVVGSQHQQGDGETNEDRASTTNQPALSSLGESITSVLKPGDEAKVEEEYLAKVEEEDLEEKDTDPKTTETLHKEVQIGNRVEIYSHSKQQWCPGVIRKVWMDRTDPMVTVEYRIGNQSMSQEIATHHPNLRVVGWQSRPGTVEAKGDAKLEAPSIELSSRPMSRGEGPSPFPSESKGGEEVENAGDLANTVEAKDEAKTEEVVENRMPPQTAGDLANTVEAKDTDELCVQRRLSKKSLESSDGELEDNQPEEDNSVRPPTRQVLQIEKDGCLTWETILKKETQDDKYGFVQANGRVEYKQRILLVSPRSKESPPVDDNSPGPNTLVVRRINQGGLLEQWNKRHPEAEVKPQDRITSVNGETTIEGMQTAIRNPRIHIKFARYPERFAVTLKKGGSRLGFRFERPTNQSLQELRISEVLTDGALADHNAKQAAKERWHFTVLPDMRVEMANAVKGDAWEMAEELKRCDTVTIQVRRAEAVLLTQQQVRARLSFLASFRSMQQKGGKGDQNEGKDEKDNPKTLKEASEAPE